MSRAGRVVHSSEAEQTRRTNERTDSDQSTRQQRHEEREGREGRAVRPTQLNSLTGQSLPSLIQLRLARPTVNSSPAVAPRAAQRPSEQQQPQQQQAICQQRTVVAFGARDVSVVARSADADDGGGAGALAGARGAARGRPEGQRRQAATTAHPHACAHITSRTRCCALMAQQVHANSGMHRDARTHIRPQRTHALRPTVLCWALCASDWQ